MVEIIIKPRTSQSKKEELNDGSNDNEPVRIIFH